MKKFFIAAILLSTVTGTTFAANSGTIIASATGRATPAAVNNNHPGDIPVFNGMNHFVRKFPQATEVICKVTGQFTEVNFMWNGLRLQAFYNGAGEPIATARPVAISGLPLFVQLSLKKEYPEYVVIEASEFSDADDALSYYVTVSGPKASYLLHVSTSGTISVFKKMKH